MTTVRCTNCKHNPGHRRLCPVGHRHVGGWPHRCPNWEPTGIQIPPSGNVVVADAPPLRLRDWRGRTVEAPQPQFRGVTVVRKDH
jgi:hypothetical protein